MLICVDPTASITTRTASIDRSSSDKENNSSSTTALLTVIKQNQSMGSRRGRITMTNSGKKSESKSASKVCQNLEKVNRKMNYKFRLAASNQHRQVL